MVKKNDQTADFCITNFILNINKVSSQIVCYIGFNSATYTWILLYSRKENFLSSQTLKILFMNKKARKQHQRSNNIKKGIE
jgi:hypothetical protein